MAEKQRRNLLLLFKPREGYFITPILIDINLAIFVLMVVSGAGFIQPETQSLIAWGADVRYLTLGGQWWRIITSFFVHIGILHVLFNMYALLYIGMLLERQLGRPRFLAAYLLTGIMSSLASLYWHPNTLSAGASGAIFGMYGVFLALLTTNLIEKKTRSALMSSIVIFVAFNLAYGTSGGIDNAAHIGGLVSGMLIGYLYYPGLRKPQSPGLAYSAIVLAALLVGATAIIAFKKIPNDYPVFEQKMLAFDRLEQRAVDVMKPITEGNRSMELANAIRDTGIRDWQAGIRILKEARQLDVAEAVKARTDVLIRYCNLRILSYEYYYRWVTNTAGPSAVDSAQFYNSQIKELLDSLK
jgi:rhomboid protease GluP